jgi:hypothetical protein
MTNAFITAIETEMNNTTTWNGAVAFKSTMSSIVDLFGKIGSARNDIEQARKLFAKAYKSDPETATRILFYARDIRGGQGEREVFKTLFKYLVTEDSKIANQLISLIPLYGRWDDLLVLEDTESWNTALEVIQAQFNEDVNNLEIENASVSLLGKWLPSTNASSKESRRLGLKIAVHLGLTERQYRKTLASLRKRIDIVETYMCSKEFSEINYAHLPSRAGFIYRKAFKKHDESRYTQYLSDVESGKEKMNAGTLYPYDIVREFRVDSASRNNKTLDLMWERLPNYMDKPFNGIVVADTSASMGWSTTEPKPIDVCVSLAMYIAERNTGVWKDMFMTFSDRPALQKIVGNTISNRIQNLINADWGGSTNIQAVFDTILATSVKSNVSPEDMPQKIIIISDMQFNSCCTNLTNFEMIKQKYQMSGYELPQLVFWQVNATNNTPITVDDLGVCLVSGASPSILKALLADKPYTPLDVVKDAVYNERYDLVGEIFS